MTWPIPTLPTNFANATSQFDAHPQAHNALADAINEIANRGGFIVSGAYTPTLTNLTIGTGGSPLNAANYIFIGGPDVGDKGILRCSGQIRIGSTGFSVGASTPVSLTIPAGFNFSFEAGNAGIGSVRVLDANPAAWIAFGQMIISGSSTAANIEVQKTDQVYLFSASIGPTVPITWAVGDEIYWNLEASVVRV